MTQHNKILIVIPAYNEEDSIVNTCNKIHEYNKNNKTHYDFVVINDGSTDRTYQKCIENKIPCLSLKNNLGIGGAVQTGYKYAKKNNYDIAIQFDGDGQHEVKCIKDIIQPLLNNESDMVIGSRFISKDSSHFKSSQARRIGINLISILLKITTGIKIYDTTSGFRAINKDIIDLFATQYPNEYPEPVSLVSIKKNHKKIIEVPVKMHERIGGKSSINHIKSVYFMINVFLYIITEAIGGYKYEY